MVDGGKNCPKLCDIIYGRPLRLWCKNLDELTWHINIFKYPFNIMFNLSFLPLLLFEIVNRAYNFCLVKTHLIQYMPRYTSHHSISISLSVSLFFCIYHYSLSISLLFLSFLLSISISLSLSLSVSLFLIIIFLSFLLFGFLSRGKVYANVSEKRGSWIQACIKILSFQILSFSILMNSLFKIGAGCGRDLLKPFLSDHHHPGVNPIK